MSWSSGKDSATALHELSQDRSVEVVGLITSYNSIVDRVAMHGVRMELVRMQAERLGIPLIECALPSPCTNEDYQSTFGKALLEAQVLNYDSVAFGDLFLEDVQDYRRSMMSTLKLASEFPVWGRDTEHLASSLESNGMRAILTCIDTSQLSDKFLGRELTPVLLEKFPTSVDPCGENGEFHTFVHASPNFSSPISVKLGEVVKKGQFSFIDLIPTD